MEKNLPDDNVGSGSTLVGCSPLSWCGIVSQAGVIVVCIGGVATHPLQAIRFVSRFSALSGVIGCIVCMVPVWVPLCMVAGLIFGVPVGAAHNFVALWTGISISVMIGRYFFREPIRERLFGGDAFAYRFMWRFRWRERHRFSTSSSVLPFICDCFLQHAWKLKNFNTVGAKRLHCPDVCSSRVSKSTTVLPKRHELTLVDTSRPRVLHKAMPWRIWQVQSASTRSCMEVDVPVRDRLHGVILTMEVAQIQLSTVWRIFLCSNRDKGHGFSGSRQWRYL